MTTMTAERAFFEKFSNDTYNEHTKGLLTDRTFIIGTMRALGMVTPLGAAATHIMAAISDRGIISLREQLKVLPTEVVEQLALKCFDAVNISLDSGTEISDEERHLLQCTMMLATFMMNCEGINSFSMLSHEGISPQQIFSVVTLLAACINAEAAFRVGLQVHIPESITLDPNTTKEVIKSVIFPDPVN